MSQEVKNVKVSDMVLWTENPRDPIDPESSDQDIVNRAISDTDKKWTLKKLVNEMGEYYDFSELPTVVYYGDKPIVYDGNRRMILAKLKHGFVSIENAKEISIPDIPIIIPCNVCDHKTAIRNIYRKHADSGSWGTLERDIFVSKYMDESKSAFLLLDEKTGIISNNPHLNQRFVKEEIFKKDILEKIGFQLSEDGIESTHSNHESKEILQNISEKVREKVITTRKKRGKIIEVLDPNVREIIDTNKDKSKSKVDIDFSSEEAKEISPKITKRTKKRDLGLFGKKLYLQYGEVSDIYRDICDLFNYYLSNKGKLSDSFPSLIRMSLRLLCESALKGKYDSLDELIKNNFDSAKLTLDQDEKTTLANYAISKESIIQLLHTGAHNYKASKNMEQTIALSIIIGAILAQTHGRET